MYCRNCGKNVEDGLNFCTNCGARVGSAPGSAPIRPNTGVPPYKTDRVEPVFIAKRKMRWPLLIVLLVFLVFSSGLTIFAAVKLKGAAGEWAEQVEAVEEEEEVSADKDIEERLDEEELRLARNEIYARRGRKFTDAQLQSYFDSCSWYVGTIEPDAFSDSMLNAYEIANRNLIVEYEEEHGYR